ncbi:MAG: cytochrome c [Acidobacteria bacterium]|nr:cytochrome c [Acidobacteriota bacterium]
MKLRILAATIAISILLSAGPWLQGAGDAQAGKAVYDAKCKTCHGADGKGNAALAKTLKVEFKDLASKEAQARKDEELKKVSTEGTGKMQPVKGLTEKQAEDVVAFIRSLAKA